MAPIRRNRGDRGATLVEYALMLSLITVPTIGAVGALRDRAADRFVETGAQIASTDTPSDGETTTTTTAAPVPTTVPAPPTTVAPTTTTTVAIPTTTTVLPTTTIPAPSLNLPVCDSDSCDLTIKAAPPGATVEWSVEPEPTSSDANGLSFTFRPKNKTVTYTVKVEIQPGDVQLTSLIACKRNGACQPL